MCDRSVPRLNNLDVRRQLAERFTQNLQLLNQTLAKSEISDRYAIFGGLLLGLVRDGQPLPGDLDADFYYLDHYDSEFENAIARLIEVGFEPLYRFRANDGDYWEHTFHKDRAKFEFFRCRRVGNSELQYYDFVPMRPARQQLKRYPDGPLRRFTFLNCQWLAAADLDLALTMHYGDWRKHDRSWRWDRDPQTLEIEPWQYWREMNWAQGPSRTNDVT